MDTQPPSSFRQCVSKCECWCRVGDETNDVKKMLLYRMVSSDVRCGAGCPGVSRGCPGVSRGVTRVTTAGGPHIRSGIAEQESASGDMQGNIIFIFFLFGHHRKSVLTWRRVAPRPAVIWSRDWCLDSARRNPPHCREKKSPAVAR